MGAILEQFASCWEELEDPRSGNAALHDFHELLMIAFCAVLCGGQSAVDMALFAEGEGAFLARFPEVGKRAAEPRHLQPTVPSARPGSVPSRLPTFHGEVFDSVSGGYRDRRESVAAFVRQGQRQIAAAHGQRLGLRATPGVGANRHRREIERDHRRPQAVGDAVAEGDDRDHRCAQLPTSDRRADRPTGRRLCAGPKGKPGHSAR